MKPWYKLSVTTLTCLAAVTACNKSTSSDPATVERSSLNPPTALASFTGDTKLVLTFNGINTEVDFQGYDVFVVSGKKVSDLTAGKTFYPNNAKIDPTTAESSSIPRCLDNSAIFEAFGFPASTKTCKGGSSSGASDSSASSSLHLDDTTTAASGDPAPTQMALCDENTSDKTISLVATKSLEQQICTISKTSDGKALVNGTTYSIFVASVSGTKKNTLSWTSNFVQDTPAASLFSGTLTFKSKKAFMFSASNLTSSPFSAYSTTATDATLNCADAAYVATVSGQADSAICKINNNNAVLTNSAADGIYFGRNGGASLGTYPARVLVSVPASSAIQILPRGPQLTVAATGGNADATSPGLPDDQAVSDNTQYDSSGTLYPVSGMQVFDLVVTKSGTKHYGKLIIGQVSVAGDPTDAVAPPSVVSLPVTIIMQPQAGSVDYFN